MKIIYILVIFNLLVSLIYSCNSDRKTGDIELQNGVTVKKKNADFSDVLFFTSMNHVFGLDPDSYEIDIDLQFNTIITFGDKTEDGRLFIADNGKGGGEWGTHIFVINSEGKMIQKIETLPNPYTVKIVENKLFVDSAVYYDDGYTALSVFDIDSYNLVYRAYDIVNWITNRESWLYKNNALLGIVPLEYLKREGHILKLDLNTFENEKIFRFTQRFPLEIYSLLIDGDSLFVVYKNSLIIDVFNLPDNTLVQSIDVKRVIKLLSHYTPEQLSLYDPRINNDTIAILLCDTGPGLNSSLQKLIVLKRDTFQPANAIDLDPSVDISNYNLEYAVKGKLFFKHFDKIAVYDCDTGNLLHEVLLSEN